MLTIWGRASSSNVMKVLFLCEELGLPFERRDAGGAFGGTDTPGYLAMNPMGRIPTVVEPDGFTLWESNTILRYLGAGSALVPEDRRARAAAERWMDWQLGHLNAPMTTILFTLYRTPEAQRDAAGLERAVAEAQALWDIAAEAAAAEDGLAGPAPTLADIALAPYLHRWLNFPVARRDSPALAAWHARLMGRPGFARHVAVPIG